MEERSRWRQGSAGFLESSLTLKYMAKKFTSYTTGRFSENVFGADILDKVVEWIRDNLRPEDIFEDDELAEWANDSGYVKPE